MTDLGSGVRVLVVDDDDDLRGAMTFCLRRARYVVTAVASGDEALAAARTQRPVAAIVDLLLPGAGGPAVAEALRSVGGLEALPVVFTTALAAQPVLAALPGAEVLFKPFTRDELVDRVDRLVAGDAGCARRQVP